MDTTRASLLIRLRNKGDTVAWSQFDAIYRPMLHRFARAKGLNEHEADDVVQHCLSEFARHIEEFQYDPSRGRFKAWLRTLVNNHIRNLFRRRSEKQADSGVFRIMEDEGGAPDDLFDRIWLREHLTFCLEEIRTRIEDTTYRAFVAYAIEEQPVEMVCEAFGMKQGQVHLIKWRVTGMLRESMKELIGDCQ